MSDRRPRLALQVNGLRTKASSEALHAEHRAFLELFLSAGWQVHLFDWRDCEPSGLSRVEAVEASTWSPGNPVHLPELADVVIFRALGPIERDRRQLAICWDLLAEHFGHRVINQPAWMASGSDKHYLLDLQSAGWPVVPTVLAPPVGSIAVLRRASPWPLEETVIKPIHGECGNSVARCEEITDEWLEHKVDVVEAWLLQPFVPEIADGERSLIFVGGRYCYSVLKQPRQDDFRNNRRWIDSISLYEPSGEELDLGTSLVDSYAEPPHICRVDLVHAEKGPLILEFETVNPSLYIGQVADSSATHDARARLEELARDLAAG